MKTVKPPRPHQVAPSPAWTLDQGVSQTLLNKFLGCRERFRLYSVEGCREKGGKEAMDFGTYFHNLLELKIRHPNKSAQSILLLNSNSIVAKGSRLEPLL